MRSFLVAMTSLALLTGCVTTGFVKNSPDFPKYKPIQIEDDHLRGQIDIVDDSWVKLSLENKTDAVITLTGDLASFSTSIGESYKLVPEGTRFIDSGKSVPSIPIPPRAKFTKEFASGDSFHYSTYGGWDQDPWIPRDLSGTSFVFGYRAGDKDSFLIFPGTAPISEKGAPRRVGSVDIDRTFWNPLFVFPTPEQRRQTLIELAQVKAEKEFGSGVLLDNLDFKSTWSGWSLLFYFSMFGFVEDATLTADVVH
jgi:hypothetical protein